MNMITSFSMKSLPACHNIQQFLVHARLVCLTMPQKCCLHKQTINENLSIPSRPKKPSTPFLKFMVQIRPDLVKENPEKTFTELSKLVSQRWSVADSKLKETLNNEYLNEISEYNKLKQEYDNKLTPEQKACIDLEKRSKMEAKENKEKKKKIKSLGKPKLPVSSFLRFLQSRKEESSKYSTHKDWVKATAEEWRNLQPNVKSQLQEEYRQEHDQWAVELKKWEDKMVKEGHLDVVRKGTLRHEPTRKMKKT